MTTQIQLDLDALERRISALRMSDPDRLTAMAAMQNGFMIVDGFAALGARISQFGAFLFSKPGVAR